MLKPPSLPLRVFRCPRLAATSPRPASPPVSVGRHPVRRGRIITGAAPRIGRIRNRFGAGKEPPFLSPSRPANSLLPGTRPPHHSRRRKGAGSAVGASASPRSSSAGPSSAPAASAQPGLPYRVQKDPRQRAAASPPCSLWKAPQQSGAPRGRGNLAAAVSSSPGSQTFPRQLSSPLPRKKSFC